MATYLELMDRAHQLMSEAEQMRKKEISDVIDDIRAKMQTYGLTVDDIAKGGGARAKRPTKQSRASRQVMYRGPNGETWAGGRGRRPKWVEEVLASGKDLEEFRSKNGA